MRHLLLSGGPSHDFASTSAAIATIAADAGFVTTVVTEPVDAFAALRAARRGERPPWHLLTVNALRWQMDADRYAHERARFAWTLDDEDARVLDQHVASGGGLLAMHTAVICFDGHPTWRRLVGGAWNWQCSSHPPVGPITISPTAPGRAHPITAETTPFSIVDELYGRLEVDDATVPMLVGRGSDGDHPVLWARSHGRGRVVTDVLGHGPDSLAHPTHRALLGRAARWAAGSAPVSTPDPISLPRNAPA